jgi:hypothetical protein
VIGVGLGSAVNVKVGKGVFVGVWVPVAVIVTVAVPVGGMIAAGAWRSAKKTITAPIPRNIARSPIAAGKLKVIEGMRLPWTTFSDWLFYHDGEVSTTDRTAASSFTRVPQVGTVDTVVNQVIVVDY